MQQTGEIIEGPEYLDCKKRWAKPKQSKDSGLIADKKNKDKKESKVSVPKHNVPKEKENIERNVPECNTRKENNKMLLIGEDIKRKYKIESHEQLFAYDTAVEYNDTCDISIRNYLKLMKKLGLSMFQRVKTYVDERESARDKGKYFTFMAKLELSENAISDPDKNKSKNSKKVDKKK